MAAELIAIAGPLKGGTFTVDRDKFVLGRDLADHLYLDDQAVSRGHCAIVLEAGRFHLHDLESRNGTLLNGAAVKENPLESGDELNVGASVFIFVVKADVVKADAPPQPRDGGIYNTSTRTLALRPDESIYLLSSAQSRERSVALPGRGRAEADLASLLRISTALCRMRDPVSVTSGLVEMIREAIPCDRIELVLLDQTAPVRSADLKAVSESVTVLEDDRVLVAPLLSNGRVVALLRLEADGQVFDQGHLHCLGAVGAIASLAFENATHIEYLEGETQRLRAESGLDHEIIGEGPRIRAVLQLVAKVAPSASTVLIQGESGTGKELVARAIHRNSPRAAMPFVAINCATLSESLLESELFGHEKGAFTTAVAQKKGKLEVADGGTLFLDEIGEMAVSLQPKLLRVLQEREFVRIGGTRTLKTDIRILAATNRNLAESVREGAFRQDLYYRLNVIRIEMPPLRERREDIPLLANFFAAKEAARTGRRIAGISPLARACLVQYDWPGNVRELGNAIECAVVLGTSELIEPEDLPPTVVEMARSPGEISGYLDAVREAKKRIILAAIEQSNGSQLEAARSLGVNPTYLSRLIRNLGLRP